MPSLFMSDFPLHFQQIPKSAMAPKALPNSLISTLPLRSFFTPSPTFWPQMPPPWGPWTPLLLLCKLSIWFPFSLLNYLQTHSFSTHPVAPSKRANLVILYYCKLFSQHIQGSVCACLVTSVVSNSLQPYRL